MITTADIERFLAEDVGGGDLTTEALGIGPALGTMEFRARGTMVVAGIDIARRMMAELSVELFAADGDAVPAGTLVLSARGSAAALHRAWKSAQTLMEIASGVATATRELVDAAAMVDPSVRISTTRKTVPGARKLSQLAVRAGGGILHRQGLGETIRVFAEHRTFLPGWTLRQTFDHLRRTQPEKSIGIEVGDVGEAVEAAAAGFQVIQLEKFTAGQIAEVARLLAGMTPRPLLAAAGGITPDNVGILVAAGAGLIVSSWPYTARPRDISVRIAPHDYG